MNLTLQEVFRFLDSTPSSRNFVEGEAVLNAGHIVLCGTTSVSDFELHIFAVCLQTSALKSNPHEVKGQIGINGTAGCEISGMECSCKAGLGEKCKHVSAVLLYCSRMNLSQLQPISSTDVKCLWNQNKSTALKNYEPEPFETYKCFESMKINKLDETNQENMRKELLMSIPSCAFALHKSRKRKTRDTTEDSTAELNDNLTAINIIQAVEMVTNSKPMVDLSQLIVGPLRLCCQNFYDQFIVCEDFRSLCISTMNSVENWRKERQFRVTGSRCYGIFTYKKGDWENKACKYFWPKFFSNKYTKHGVEFEPLARRLYCRKYGLEVLECGLVVPPQNPFLGYSPDGIVMKDGQPWKLLEVKCPYKDHIFELSHQSENKTLLLMSQIYQSMAVLSQSPTDELYSNIRNYILINTTKGSTPTATIDITNSVHQFFSKIFPLVFHQIHSNGKKDFTPDYKACLRKTIDTILPFGDIPKQISQSLSKSLEATRLLLQAFRIGNEVLNTTDRLLIDETGKSNSGCPNALLKMTYCPKCTGLINSKPCSGYCLNVLRGCLTKYVAELESPWNGYVDGMESLVNAIKRSNVDSGINADLVIRNLDTRISEAIMRAMERGLDIGNKVKRNCGPASFTEREDPLLTENSTSIPGSGKLRSVNPRVFAALPESQLLHFQTSIAKSRGFYGNLADTLCQDGSFAEPKDQRCWNGDRIAEYTKTVVDVGLDSQKYNPEVQQTTNTQSVDPQVAELVDKLRHVHHMAMSSVGSTSGNEVDYMQRDGVDGSGSGYGPDFEDGDDENTRGSGSGNGPIDPHQRSNSQPNNAGTKVEVGVSNPNTQSTPTAGGSRHSYKSSVLNWLSLCIVLLSARSTY